MLTAGKKVHSVYDQILYDPCHYSIRPEKKVIRLELKTDSNFYCDFLKIHAYHCEDHTHPSIYIDIEIFSIAKII